MNSIIYDVKYKCQRNSKKEIVMMHLNFFDLSEKNMTFELIILFHKLSRDQSHWNKNKSSLNFLNLTIILSKSTQKITDKLEQKNECFEYKDIKDYFKPWSNRCKLHSFSFEFAENSDSNPTSIIWNNASLHGFISTIIYTFSLHQHLWFSPDDV